MDFDFLLRSYNAAFEARAEKIKEDKDQKRIDLMNAYYDCFNTESGRIVLQNLFTNFDNSITMMAPQENRDLWDTGRAAINEGRRRVLNEILDKIRIGEYC